jgi:hypothetical protein
LPTEKTAVKRKSGRGSRRNFQGPSSKLQRNLKLQTSNHTADRGGANFGVLGIDVDLEPRAWDLELLWNLELGIWSFFGTWGLGFGVSLELGDWALEL